MIDIIWNNEYFHKGRPSMGQWVTAYEVGYSLNNEDWFRVVDDNGSTVQFQVYN